MSERPPCIRHTEIHHSRRGSGNEGKRTKRSWACSSHSPAEHVVTGVVVFFSRFILGIFRALRLVLLLSKQDLHILTPCGPGTSRAGAAAAPPTVSRRQDTAPSARRSSTRSARRERKVRGVRVRRGSERWSYSHGRGRVAALRTSRFPATTVRRRPAPEAQRFSPLSHGNLGRPTLSPPAKRHLRWLHRRS